MEDNEEIDLTQFLPEEALVKHDKKNDLNNGDVQSTAQPKKTNQNTSFTPLFPHNTPLATDSKNGSQNNTQNTLSNNFRPITLPAPPTIEKKPTNNNPPNQNAINAQKEKSPLDSIPTLIVNENGETEHLTLKHVLSKYYPPEKPQKTKNKTTTGIIAFLLFGIFFLSSSIVLAENGYWPGFSTLYRQTKIPLIWKRTGANLETIALNNLKYHTNAHPLKIDLSYKLYTEAINPTAASDITNAEITTNIKRLALENLFVLPKPLNASFIKKLSSAYQITKNDEERPPSPNHDYSEEYNPQDDYTSLKEFNIQGNSQLKSDGKSYEINTEINDLSLNNSLTNFWSLPLEEDQKKITASTILVNKEKKLFFKHNLKKLKPKLEKYYPEDAWYEINLKENCNTAWFFCDESPTDQNTNDIMVDFFKNNQKAIQLILNKIEDKGITKLNGKTLAHYQGKDIFPNLKTSDNQNSQTTTLISPDFQNTTDINLWVSPKTGIVDSINLETTVALPEINTRVKFSMHLKNYSIEKINKIMAPNNTVQVPDLLNFYEQ